MSFLKDAGIGVKAYGMAHGFIVKHNLWGYVLLPGLIHIILFFITFGISMNYSRVITDWIIELTGMSGEAKSFFSEEFYYFLLITFRILFFLVYFSIFKYLVLILLSPVLALLSQKVDKLLTGNDYPFSFTQLIHDAGRGAVLALRNLALELIFIVVIFIFSFIPFVGFISPFILFFIQSYYYGFSMIDYSNERKGLKVNESIGYIWQHKGLAVANGSIFYLLFLIPFVGWMIAPAYGVVSATLATRELDVLSIKY